MNNMMISIILEDEVLGEQVPVDLDANLPVAQTLEALVQLRRLPRGTYEKPIHYELIRAYNDDVLRLDLSLAQHGIRPGETLILARRKADANNLAIVGGFVAAGVALVACIIIAVILLVSNTDAATPEPSPTYTVPPTVDLTAAASLTPSEADENKADDLENPTPVDAGNCTDDAAFVADITVPDGTVLEPGEEFVKTWRVMNTGTCVWQTTYQWVFVNEERMGAPNSVPLIESAPGGTQINISVEMVAPSAPGTYRGYWQMRNPAGNLFGQTPYVEIVVSSPATLQANASASTAKVNQVVAIQATASRAVNTLIIIVRQGTTEIERETCQNVNSCSLLFGGEDNEVVGALTYEAFACDREEGCLEAPLDRVDGVFTLTPVLDEPDALTVDFDCCVGGQYTALLTWDEVEDAADYEVYIQNSGEDTILVDRTIKTTYTIGPDFSSELSFPVTFLVRACSDDLCSDYNSISISEP